VAIIQQQLQQQHHHHHHQQHQIKDLKEGNHRQNIQIIK
jgi:hypothetical protein